MFYGAGGKEPQTGTIPSMAGKTVTPGSVAQRLTTAKKYLTGDIVVGAIPSNYKRYATGNLTNTSKGVVTGLGFKPMLVCGAGQLSGNSPYNAVMMGTTALAYYAYNGIQAQVYSLLLIMNDTGFTCKGTDTLIRNEGFTGTWHAFG